MRTARGIEKEVKHDAYWTRLREDRHSIEGALPISKELLYSFHKRRIRVEYLKCKDLTEMRIPLTTGYNSTLQKKKPKECETPQVYPVSTSIWGLLVSGGYFTIKAAKILGKDALTNSGHKLTKDYYGDYTDETIIHFPENRLDEILDTFKPRKIKPGGDMKKNLLGIS